MELLWIARTCPYPPTDGERLRVFNLLKGLAGACRITLVYRAMSEQDLAAADALRPYCRGGVHAVWVPRPGSLWRRLAWAAPFLLSRHPVSLCTVFFRDILAVLRRLTEAQAYDIVQIEHSSLSIYLDHLPALRAGARVLTMHNIDYIRFQRVRQNTPPGLMRLYHAYNAARYRAWELAALARYDRVMTMSELDAAQLRRDGVQVPLDVVPNGVDTETIACEPPRPGARDVLFVASMDSEANHDAAVWLAGRIWPLIRAGSDGLRLLLVGRGPQPALAAFHDGRSVLVTGTVDQVLPYYRDAAVVVVPLRSGGGTRLKILEAMAAGVPVVSTRIGAEGLAVTDGEHLLLADDEPALAAAVQRVLGDVALQQRLSAAARALVETRYGWASIVGTQIAVFTAARQTPARPPGGGGAHALERRSA